MNNKKGVKLLAALMVLAVAVAGFVVCTSDDSAAGGVSVMTVKIGDADATSYTASQIDNALSAINAAESAVTVEFLTDIEVDLTTSTVKQAAFWITNSTVTVTINGNGKTISPDSDDTYTSGKNVIGAGAGAKVVINKLVVDGKSLVSHHGINLFQCEATLNEVTVKDNKAAGILVNGSTVTATKIVATGNVWGDINVDTGSIPKNSSLTIDSIENVRSIWSETYVDSMTDVTGKCSTITITDKDYEAFTTSSDRAANYNGVDNSVSWIGFYNTGENAIAAYLGDVAGGNITTSKAVTINLLNNTTATADQTTIIEKTTLKVATGKTLTVDDGKKLTLNKNSLFEGVIADSNGTIFSKTEADTVTEDMTFVGGAAAEAGSADAFEDLVAGGAEDIKVTGNVNLTSMDTAVEVNSIIIDSGKTLTLPQTTNGSIKIVGGTVQGKVIGKDDASAILNLKGDFVLKAGSVDISGEISGTIEGENTSVVKISGTIIGDTTITGSGTVTFINVTVNPGVNLVLGNNITYNVDEGTQASPNYMYVYGNIKTSTDQYTTTINVGVGSTGYATFKTFGTSTVQQTVSVKANCTYATVDLADSMNTITINDDVSSSNTYSQTQTVVIASTLFLKNGTTTTILGKLVVNEGVTMVIEEGATLIIGKAGFTSAEVVVNGKIEIDEGATLNVLGCKSAEVSGQIVSDGAVTVAGTVKIKSGGKVLIDDGDSSSIAVTSGMTVEKGGELEIRGGFNISTISNKGTITLSGAVITDDSVIKMAADGAVVNIASFTASAANVDLTITDTGLVYEKINNVSVSVAKANQIVFTGVENVGVKGITITEAVKIDLINNQKYYSNDFVIAGTVIITDNLATGYTGTYEIGISETGSAGSNKSNSVRVDDSLVIGKNVVVDVASNILKVSGTITATAEGSQLKATAGTIDVTGSVETIAKITANINAFGYETMVEGTTHYNYTTLKSAISNGATTISAMGTVFILEDVEIPAGVTIKSESGAKIFVGDSETRNITVVVKDGAQLRGNNIEVKATLEFENKKDNRSNTIVSDVSVIGEVASKYTNVFTALDKAVSGDVVTIAVDVVLDRNVTIKEGVTLNIPSGKTISVAEGVTVFVNGVLKSSGSVETYDPDTIGVTFSDKAEKTTTAHTAKLDVKGTFMSLGALEYSTYRVAGAYFNMVDSTGNFNYIMPVESAAPLASKITNGQITINGENVVGDITFEGTKTQAVTVTLANGTSSYAGASLKADSVTLSYASMTITYVATYPAVFNGTVKTSVGDVEVANITGLTVISQVVNDETQMVLSGEPKKAVSTVDDKSITVLSGSILVSNTSGNGNADLTVSSIDFTIAKDAKLTVGTDAKLVSSDSVNNYNAVLVVDGELVTYDGGTIEVDTLVVNGTFTVSPADSDASIDAGSATVYKYLVVGLTYEYDSGKVTLGSNAVVNADNITGVDIVFVANGSSVNGKLLDDKKSTQFIVEDALWMTAYLISTTASDNIVIDKIKCDSIVEAQFENWYYFDSDGKKVAVGSSSPNDKKIGEVDKVIANITYEVYTVNVQVAEGIDDVYLDGILMSYVSNGIFTAMVKAGQHTIEYTLANGYGGEAVMLVNNEKVSGYKFTASGDFSAISSNPGTSYTDVVEYNIILQGIEKTGYTPDAPDNNGGSDGMSITDYLLIVLVVLIVIMAILVAIRMMRS